MNATAASTLGSTLGRALFTVAVLSAGQAAMAASLGVTADGSASYSRRIEVPPGAGQLAPALSLDYSSGRQVNGPLGVGWFLNGISVITRCETTRATDNAPPRGVAYKATDKLCLDGQRLVPTNADGTSPLVGATTQDAAGKPAGAFTEYRTEIDSFARVRAYGYADGVNAESGPAYFKVWTKSGEIVEYGASPTSVTATNGLIKAFYPPSQSIQYAQLWAVSRKSDVAGNAIHYRYFQSDTPWGSSGSFQSGHEWGIKEIQYSGNKVVFTYDVRGAASPQDSSETYNNGSKNLSLSRIRSIVTYVNSPNVDVLGPAAGAVAVKTISLSYDNGPVTKRSRLTSIQECAGTKCLAPLLMTYSPGGTDAYTKNTSFNITEWLAPESTAVADFNGDGKADLVTWDTKDVFVWYSNGDGSFNKLTSYNGHNPYYPGDTCVYKTLVADMNGDGRTDVIRYNDPTFLDEWGQCPTNPGAEIHFSNGDGTFNKVFVAGLLDGMRPPRNTSGQGDNILPGVPGKTFYVLDADGDGIPDIVTAQIPPGDQQGNPGSPLMCQGGCTHVYKGNGQGGFSEIATNARDQILYSFGSGFRGLPNVLDIDGDGNQDLLIGNTPFDPEFPKMATIVVARSRGDGNFDVVTGPTCSSGVFQNLCGAVAFDYNGSGRSSLLFAGDAGPSYNKLYLADRPAGGLSVVGSFNLTTSSDILVAPYSWPAEHAFGTGDFNGDGRHDILSAGEVNKVYLSNGDGTFSKSTTFNLTGTDVDQRMIGVFTGHSGPAFRAGFLVGDFTGRGTSDILRVAVKTAGISNTYTEHVLWTKSSSELPDLLLTLTDEMGAASSAQYATLANPTFAGNVRGPRYVTDRGTSNAATSTQVDVGVASPVVVQLNTDSGVESTKQAIAIQYAGLKADRRGRGSLGFREVRQERVAPNGQVLTEQTQYLQVFPYIGAIAATATHNAPLNAIATGNRVTFASHLYCDQTSAAGADATALSSGQHCTSTSVLRRPYLLRLVQSGMELGGTYALPTVTTQSSITASGEPLVTTRSANTGAGTPTYTRTVTNTYHTDNIACTDTGTCSWILGRVATRTERGQAPSTILPTVAASPTPHAKLRLVQQGSGTALSPSAATLQFVVHNDGDRALTHVTLSLTGSATPSNVPTTCPAAGACGTMTLTSPGTVGSYSGVISLLDVTSGATASANYALVVRTPTPPTLALSGCTPSAPATTPAMTKYTCTLSNTGETAATRIDYTTSMAGAMEPTGPGSCAAISPCGTVTLASGSEARTYTGTFTATPNIGMGVTSATATLTVLTAPSLAFGTCNIVSPTTTPTRATITCPLRNDGQTSASSIAYTTSMAAGSISGPSSCPAGSGCGDVTLTSPPDAGRHEGNLVATPSAGSGASSGIVSLVVNSQPALSLNDCYRVSPAMQGTSATFQCTLGNSGQAAATGIVYATSMSGGTVTGPGTCSGSNGNCGPVVLSSPTAVNTYTGTVTATPSVGTGVTTASTVLSVVTPPSLSFSACGGGTSTAPTPAEFRCTLRNNGGYDATLIVYSTTNSSLSASGPTSCSANNTNCGPVIMQSPSLAGTYNGAMQAKPSAGTGVDSVPVTLTVNPQVTSTTITATPTVLNFGNVSTGTTSASQTILVKNTGSLAATLNWTVAITTTPNPADSSYAAHGQVPGSTCSQGSSLAPGGQCYVAVQYQTGCAIGTKNGRLDIAGPNFNTVRVDLFAKTVNGGFTCN